MADCFHCGQPVPAGSPYQVVVAGVLRPLCCAGCQAVAETILEGGLEAFYRRRTAPAPPPPERVQAALLEEADALEDLAVPCADGSLAVELAVPGLHCAACAWLVERRLATEQGVVEASANLGARRVRVRWDPGRTGLGAVLRALAQVGYAAVPARAAEEERALARESRDLLTRLGVAGIGMMQAGLAALGGYLAPPGGVGAPWEGLLRLAGLAVATPVVGFAAAPFFRNAWRGLRAGRAGMDLPVALAIALAYVASLHATLTGRGETYFDSLAMFTFFLLLGRFLELRLRHRNAREAEGLSSLLPATALRLGPDGCSERVPVARLSPGERVLVPGGAVIPCDGRILCGASEVVEAVLTGEERPAVRRPGDLVRAGTLNGPNPLEVEVAATGGRTRLAQVLDLAARAAAERPPLALLADRLAGRFVVAVLLAAAGVFAAWWLVEPERALWVALSVLVVSCPCALSLATPAALAVATGGLRRRGFLVRRGHVLEALAGVQRLLIDKTGTLTLGRMAIAEVRPAAGVSEERLLAVAAALERGVDHPIARAFEGVAAAAEPVDGRRVLPGRGIEAVLGGEWVACGAASWVEERFGHRFALPDGDGTWLVVASAASPLGAVRLRDRLRPGAAAAVAELSAQGIAVELVSGDRPEAVAALAARLGIRRAAGGLRPEDKLQRLEDCLARGERVLAVGDGINDLPLLARAPVSVAVGAAADLTRLTADAVLLAEDLRGLSRAVAQARATRRVIRQNLSWALLYNGLALPAAALGLVPPWAAALGMSASSLLVVANALRLANPVEREAVRWKVSTC